MNINVYFEDSLAQALNKCAKLSGESRNAIIREAVKEWIINHQVKQWPMSILKFKGVKNFTSFESLRDDLLPPSEDPFA